MAQNKEPLKKAPHETPALDDAKSGLVARLNSSLTRLRYLYDIQGREFWYMELVRVTPQELQLVNDDFAKALAEDFYELATRLGNSLAGDELTVELYTFNETLTRLFSHTQHLSHHLHDTASNRHPDDTSIKTGSDHIANVEDIPYHSIENTDSTLLISTLIKVLIVKLTRLSELLSIPDRSISTIETKLIEDVLTKNISKRVLRPYHDLLSLKAHNHIESIY